MGSVHSALEARSSLPLVGTGCAKGVLYFLHDKCPSGPRNRTMHYYTLLIENLIKNISTAVALS